ncbi:kinase domain-containing protein [Xylaria cubensis]|nr:kinase domain-containing protein [Xylaria cubensis]
MASAFSKLVGITGRRYKFKERPHGGRIWLATSGNEKFVLKDVPKSIFSNFNKDIRPKLRECPHVRLPSDTIKDQHIFVYRYLTDDFLSLVRENTSLRARKQILKASLRGIAELHRRDIVHLDLKPDNILINRRSNGTETAVKQVQLSDLENAAYLPKGRCVKGMLAGNEDWRSPEGHFKSELKKSSDIFSFGAVCIYAILGRVIFGVDDDFRKREAQGALPTIIRLQRQVSYFGDRAGLNELIKLVGDEEENCEVLRMLFKGRVAEYRSYRPFLAWSDVGDYSFKDLVRRMMDLNPARRITARRALRHPWFAGLEDI